VDDFQRRNLQIAAEAKWSAGDNRMWHDLRQAPAKMRRLKDVFEDPPNVDPGTFVRVESQSAMAKVQRPNVVETKDVIGVAMRDQHSVEMFQPLAQSLLAKIGRGVNDNGFGGVFDQD